MNKIFKQNYNTLSFTKKEKEEMGNLNFYAIDNHITKESDMQDDYIAFYKEWCILVTYKTPSLHEQQLLQFMYNGSKKFELNFKQSGAIDDVSDDKLLKVCENSYNTLAYFININNPNRVYRSDVCINYDYMKNANSFLEQQEALEEFKQNSIYIDKILNGMNTQTFVQNGDYKVESDINKLVRFANSNLNNFVRNKVAKHLGESDFLFDETKYMLGASSPKRNILHNIVNTFNDLDVLCNFLIAKEEILINYINKKEQKQKQENISMFKHFMKEHPVILKGYNYHEDEIYVKCNGVHVTLKTEGFSWYDKYEKYDNVDLYDLYQHTNIKGL